MVKYLFPLCFLLFLAHAGDVQAQSFSDLNGKTWKDASTSLDVLAKAMEDSDALTRADQLATDAIEVIKFKMSLILQVSLLLADKKNVPDAIWEGYQESLQGTPPNIKIDPDAQKNTFYEVVTLLEQ